MSTLTFKATGPVLYSHNVAEKKGGTFVALPHMREVSSELQLGFPLKDISMYIFERDNTDSGWVS